MLISALLMVSVSAARAASSLGVDVFCTPSFESIGISWAGDFGRGHPAIRVAQYRRTDGNRAASETDATTLLLSYDRDLTDSLTLLSSAGVRHAEDDSRINTLRFGVDWLQSSTAWTAELHYREFDLTVQRLNGRKRSRKATALGAELAVLRFVSDNLAFGARAAKHEPDIDVNTRALLERPRLQALLTSTTSDLLFTLIEYEFAIDASLSRGDWLLRAEAGFARGWLDDTNSHYFSFNVDRSLGTHWQVDATLVRQFTEGADDSTGIGIGARLQW